MKRKIFFWVDRLHIRRSERIALVMLMTFLVILTAIAFHADQTPDFDPEHYAELEKEFAERSAQQRDEYEAIMARYTTTEHESGTEESNHEVQEMKENVKTPEAGEPTQEISDTTRININTADTGELQKLPGIGPAYSERIVEWRNTNGRFTEVEQLLEIRGIGPVRLEKLKPYIEL